MSRHENTFNLKSAANDAIKFATNRTAAKQTSSIFNEVASTLKLLGCDSVHTAESLLRKLQRKLLFGQRTDVNNNASENFQLYLTIEGTNMPAPSF